MCTFSGRYNYLKKQFHFWTHVLGYKKILKHDSAGKKLPMSTLPWLKLIGVIRNERWIEKNLETSSLGSVFSSYTCFCLERVKNHEWNQSKYSLPIQDSERDSPQNKTIANRSTADFESLHFIFPNARLK